MPIREPDHYWPHAPEPAEEVKTQDEQLQEQKQDFAFEVVFHHIPAEDDSAPKAPTRMTEEEMGMAITRSLGE